MMVNVNMFSPCFNLFVLANTLGHKNRNLKFLLRRRHEGDKREVVYNNSSKKLTEEQMDLLAMGLNFGIAPRKFPLVESITATEALCQRLEECGDSESVEKARAIRNEVFAQVKEVIK